MSAGQVAILVVELVGLTASIFLCIVTFRNLRGSALGPTVTRVLPFLWVALLVQAIVRFASDDTAMGALSLCMASLAAILWSQHRSRIGGRLVETATPSAQEDT